jgi:hypothetical protein
VQCITSRFGLGVLRDKRVTNSIHPAPIGISQFPPMTHHCFFERVAS